MVWAGRYAEADRPNGVARRGSAKRPWATKKCEIFTSCYLCSKYFAFYSIPIDKNKENNKKKRVAVLDRFIYTPLPLFPHSPSCMQKPEIPSLPWGARRRPSSSSGGSPPCPRSSAATARGRAPSRCPLAPAASKHHGSLLRGAFVCVREGFRVILCMVRFAVIKGNSAPSNQILQQTNTEISPGKYAKKNPRK